MSLLIVGLFVGGGMIGIWANNASARPGDVDDDGLADSYEKNYYYPTYTKPSITLKNFVWSTESRLFSWRAKVAFQYWGSWDDGYTGNVGTVALKVDSSTVSTTYLPYSASWTSKEIIVPSDYTGNHQFLVTFTPLNRMVRVGIDPIQLIPHYATLFLQNINLHGMTNYTMKDTDGDKMDDGDEVIIFGKNPLIFDADPFLVKGIPLKSGKVAMITWNTPSSNKGFVDYSTDYSYSSRVVESSATTQHMMMITGLIQNTLYHFRIGIKGSVPIFDTCGGDHTFTTQYWDGSKYTVNLLVSIEPDIDPVTLGTWSNRITNLATFFYDALDGKMRIGNVTITDNNAYANVADIRVRMDSNRVVGGIPADRNPSDSSGYFTPSGTIYGISSFGTQADGDYYCIEMPYNGPQWRVNNIWWPTDTWRDGLNDLTSSNQTTAVLMHEFGHYGLNIAGHNPSRNNASDWSIMGVNRGRWVTTTTPYTFHSYTEFEPSNSGKTGQEEWDIIKSKYPNLTETTSSIAGPDGNGGTLNIITMNRGTL